MLGIVLQLDVTVLQAQRNQCASCLTLSPVVELSTSGGPIVPSMLQYVLRTTDGRWFVSHLFINPPQIVIYDAAGRFLQLYDNAGQGPGQFRIAPLLFAGPADTIWAFDRERAVRFDNRLRHIDTKNLGQPRVASKAVVLTNGSVVVDMKDAAAEGGYYALSVLDTAGTVTRRLERESDEYGHTIVAPAAGDGFWTLRSNQLLLRRYSDSGDLIRSVTIVTDHFQPWQGPLAVEGREGSDVPPRPRHQAILDVGGDHLVVFTWVVGPEWTARPSNQSFRPSDLNHDQLYDTIVVLVDLRTGLAVESRRVPEALAPVSGAADLVHSTRVDSDGHVITRIQRLQLRQP